MSTITFTPQPAPIRLTVRGKAVVLTIALIAIAILAIAFGPSVVATSQSGAAADVRTVEVTASTTLWDLAADANPAGDIRETVDEIVELNSLPSASALTPGTSIAVPVYTD